MARYGTLIAWAGVLDKKDVVALLQANLDQEKKADTLLTQIAGSVNPAAAKVG
jgi:ferritin-like metal-binding protein YciE